MRRIHAVELEDLPWFPAIIRDAGTAYLRFIAEYSSQAAHLKSVVEPVLRRSGEKSIIDLCSGGGGPVLEIVRQLSEEGFDVELTLTDLYPNENAVALVNSDASNRIRYDTQPVDAREVSGERRGLRTLFNAFHHFRPEAGRQILANAVAARQPIVIGEIFQRSPTSLVAMLFNPLLVFLVIPFVRPLRAAWIPLTYLLPVIPLFVMWDGIVSCLRSYEPEELLRLAREADPDDRFDWQVQDVRMNLLLAPGVALVGIPRERLAGAADS